MSEPTQTAFIGLGSNQGDRGAFLRSALDHLDADEETQVERVSAVYESDPLPGPVQGRFLNAVAQLSTCRPPERLLELMLAAEAALGRVRTERWGPRIIDLDLLLYGEKTVNEPRLEVPHPELSKRRFVLVPLAELAPDARDPRSGRTVAQLLENCPLDPRLDRIDLELWAD